MKKSILTVLTVLTILPVSVFAQSKYGADSAECIKYLSYYKEYFKQKSYDDALPNWRQAYKYCPPSCNQTMLVDGTTLLRRVITKNAKNTIYKDSLVDSLLTLHAQRAEFFPKNALTAYNNMGIDLSNYVKDDIEKLYNGFETIIAANGAQTKPSIFLFDLKCAIEKYQAGALDAEAIINIYQRNMGFVDAFKPSTETEELQIKNLRGDIENLFISSKVASCDNLIALYTPRYEAGPQDIHLIKNIVKMMSVTEGCTDNDLFLNAVTSMYTMEPSADAAYFLYKLHSSKGNVKEAISYMEEAISRDDSDVSADASYKYELAVFCFKNGHAAKAYEYASQVPAMDQSLAGKSYLLMGTIWGSQSCGGDEIARRAPFWVACDYMSKAKAADETLAEDANRNIANYSKYFPQTAEAFMYDLKDGDPYTVVCGGIKASTTVRTIK